jgi:threonine/homoserine/homoserine lactone efflux protein
MGTELFFKGWLIGFSIAMPVGPIALICIRHSLTFGLMGGLMAGLGAALADALFGALAAFGVGLVAPFLEHHFVWAEALGAIVLIGLGIHNMRLAPPAPQDASDAVYGKGRVFWSTFVLTLTNPMTLMAFAGVYAAFGICCYEQPVFQLLILTCGVLLGSATWWLLLCTGTALIGKRWQLGPSPWLNRLSGGIILAFGLVAALDVLRQFL